MNILQQVIKSMLIKLSGNNSSQWLLKKGVFIAQYLMGIGSGGFISSSGERVLVDKLNEISASDRSLCIFDVGANKGDFILLLERGLQVTPFHIHAFEPSRFTYNLLHDTVKEYSNLTLNNFGLGKNAGEFDLFYDEPGSGLSSLSKRNLEHRGISFKYSEKVAIDTLDNYCSKHAIEKIDLLKLDVEGHELDVLQGGMELFKKRKIKMVSFEFGSCNIDTRTYFRDFHYFFRNNFMNHMFRITPSGHLVPISEYHELHEQFRAVNYLVLQ